MIVLYEKYGQYYDLIYSSVDYVKESREIAELLESSGETVRTILDLGCGTGNYVVNLTGMRYSVHGVDSSPAMIDAARAKLEDMNKNMMP